MTLAEYRKRPPDTDIHVEPEEAGHEPGAKPHPGPLEYARIGLVLAVVTMIEVAIYYMSVSHTVLVVALITLSALKFSLVVLWFMHLRFDSRLFSQLFVGGFLLALSVFFVALATLGAKLT
ncbi:MAG: cytochrome C oxidase subunit IV [Chloroflexi bacterium]|nr:MAG: cytochrome C oxidase subunit IV [Chloroflexota bacterium]